MMRPIYIVDPVNSGDETYITYQKERAMKKAFKRAQIANGEDQAVVSSTDQGIIAYLYVENGVLYKETMIDGRGKYYKEVA